MHPRVAQARPRYPHLYKFRAPRGFAEAVAATAAQHHQTASDFVRQLLLREMRKAGVMLRADGTIATPKDGPPLPL
ncbi:MAG TPA: hypothetical protein VNK52_14295 [Hyphomicrobiaceae bacterium]|nr:hypothetical protein [Hyphomicrobiaceae bacterium]